MIYVLNVTLKTGIFTTASWILENLDVPIFGGFESKKSRLSQWNWDNWQVYNTSSTKLQYILCPCCWSGIFF